MNDRNLFRTGKLILVAIMVVAWNKTPISGLDVSAELTRESDDELHFGFDGKLDDSIRYGGGGEPNAACFPSGVAGKSLTVGTGSLPSSATIDIGDEFSLNAKHDFSIEFWIRTTARADQRFVVLSKKTIPDNSLQSQKQKGWAFRVGDGTWAWNVGSGNRRLTYQRENGQYMPINDGRWHQLVLTFNRESSLIRLYFDGRNRATYNIADKDGFDFSNDSQLIVGWAGDVDSSNAILPAIEEGAKNLQKLVDQFNGLGLPELQPGELMDLVVAPDRLLQTKKSAKVRAITKEDLNSIKRLRSELSRNPYTVHQVADFMQVAPLLKLYRLVGGRIEIDRKKALAFTARERFSRPHFDIDELSIFRRELPSKEVTQRYAKYFLPPSVPRHRNLKRLTAAAFNIHHGGKHETVEEDGWDSRELIAEIIRREEIDVVMMQETYSSGDFIAAELGYYFATTVDWDYLNQGANISVLSRYPIKEIVVPPNSSFMNVAARVAISETQEIEVMSNWYGMNNFQDVFDFHAARFSRAANIPILFAGDFNAVPHTDGGKSPASAKLLAAGFRDAYREQYPDVEKYPGFTHVSRSRIDQLYYKGSGLKHSSTKILSTWPSKFPSDHFLIKSVFELDYATSRGP